MNLRRVELQLAKVITSNRRTLTTVTRDVINEICQDAELCIEQLWTLAGIATVVTN